MQYEAITGFPSDLTGLADPTQLSVLFCGTWAASVWQLCRDGRIWDVSVHTDLRRSELSNTLVT